MPIFIIIPLIVIIFVVRYSIRHWRKATWYFRLAGYLALATFGVSFILYWFWIANNIADDPLSGLAWMFLPFYPTLIAGLCWCIVWSLGFLVDLLWIKKT
jgi:ACR3 family arsenite efflux pump ArsB